MSKQRVVASIERRYAESQVQTASYIADLLMELEEIAARERIEPLDTLLKIAREEARRIANSA